jgi:hypothetical protein
MLLVLEKLVGIYFPKCVGSVNILLGTTIMERNQKVTVFHLAFYGYMLQLVVPFLIMLALMFFIQIFQVVFELVRI